MQELKSTLNITTATTTTKKTKSCYEGLLLPAPHDQIRTWNFSPVPQSQATCQSNKIRKLAIPNNLRPVELALFSFDLDIFEKIRQRTTKLHKDLIFTRKIVYLELHHKEVCIQIRALTHPNQRMPWNEDTLGWNFYNGP